MIKAIRIEIIKKCIDIKSSNNITSNPKILSICLLREDLTIQKSNAIVNAANAQLQLGGGVAGAIRIKGGYKIQDECDDILLLENNDKSLNNGNVAYTNIGNFQNENLKYIFHAVGPIYYNGKKNEKRDLITCFLNCFRLADRLKLNSIALPPISTGIFGYPKEEGAEVFFDCVENYFKEFLNSIPIENNKEKEEINELQKIKKLTLNENDSLYFNPITKENNVNLTKRENKKDFEDINKEIKVTKKASKTKVYEDINKKVENDQENNLITALSNKHNYEDINHPFIPQKNSNKNKIETNKKQELIEETKHSKNDSLSPYLNKIESLNVDEFIEIKKEESLNQEKDQQSRIMKSNYDDNFEIQLENYTLIDINIAIIDKLTHEIFLDVLQKKFIDWSKKSEYEVKYTEC